MTSDDPTLDFVIRVLDALGDRFSEKNRFEDEMRLYPMGCQGCGSDMGPWRTMYHARGWEKTHVWKCPQCGMKRAKTVDTGRE